MNRMYRTPKGTELPILSLRGRDYLEVKYRLVWFREEHPDWSIETEILAVTEMSAYARATIKDEEGRIIATSHKFETKAGFPDFIEKAETGAIGRALALIGFGTQFCADELDEGERIVDSPVDQLRSRSASQERRAAAGAPPREAFGDEQESFEQETFAPLESRAAEDASAAGEPKNTDTMAGEPADPGEYRISFGKKYKGKRLRDIPRREIESYMQWLEGSADKKGVALSDEARYLKKAVDRYLAENKAH